MSTLPVFPIIKRAFVFLALNLGTLLRLYLTALGLILAAVFLTAGAFALVKTWVVALPCVAFIFFASAPCMMRTYQLAALGEMDPSGYLSSLFTSQSLRYVGYWLLVTLITGFGLTLSLLPAMLTGALGNNVVFEVDKYLAVLVSAGLVITFLVLIGPINLVYPAVSLEREPSLASAYALGAHCKLRLFWIMALPGLLFGLLSQVVEMVGGLYGVSEDLGKTLLMTPLNLILVFMSLVVNSAVFALAYRFLRGLPHHDPAGPLPGEAPAWPGGRDAPDGPEGGPAFDVQATPDQPAQAAAPAPDSAWPRGADAPGGPERGALAPQAQASPTDASGFAGGEGLDVPPPCEAQPAPCPPASPAEACGAAAPAQSGFRGDSQPRSESAPTQPDALSAPQDRSEEDKAGNEAKNKAD